MAEKRPRPLVVDTSVALKFYLPEEGHEEALKLLEAEESGAAELLAPGTILPEGFNAIVWQQKRGLLDAEDAGEAWEKLLRAPIYTYATEDLIERARRSRTRQARSSTIPCSWRSPRTRSASWSPPTASCSRRLKGPGTLRWPRLWNGSRT